MARDMRPAEASFAPARPAGSKAEALADVLRRSIARGDLAENSSLPPEAEMLRRFDISRPTYREAIRVLEAEGLLAVDRGARGGTRVLRPSLRPITRQVALYLQLQPLTVKDVDEFRIQVEPEAAASIARLRQTEPLSALADCAEEQADLLRRARLSPEGDGAGSRMPAASDAPGPAAEPQRQKGAPQAWSASSAPRRAAIIREYLMIDSRFRLILARSCGNAINLMIAEIIEDIVGRHLDIHGPSIDILAMPGFLPGTLAAKQRLIAHMAEGEDETARSFWRDHLMWRMARQAEEGLNTCHVLPIGG